MIRHIVLFKFKPGFGWEHPQATEAEALARRVGAEVPQLRSWYAGRNVSDRAVAYDFAVIGEVDDERALDGYLYDPFHQKAVAAWREISDWIVADLRDADAAKTP